MSPMRTVLLLTVLLPLLGEAQEPTDAPVAETTPPSAPPLVPAPRKEPEASGSIPQARPLEQEEPYDGTAGRIAFESLGAVGGGGVGALLGAGGGSLLMDAFDCPFSSSGNSSCPDEDLVYFGTVSLGVSLGATLGVWGSGSLMGGQGRFLPTLLGAAVGSGLSLLGIVSGAADEVPPLIPLILLAPIFGPIIGYEASDAGAVAPAPASTRAESGPRVYPVLGASSRGAALGLAGSF